MAHYTVTPGYTLNGICTSAANVGNGGTGHLATAINAWSTWTGHPTEVFCDALGQHLTNPQNRLAQATGTTAIGVWTVGLLPEESDGSAGTFVNGLNGNYDSIYANVAVQLVNYGRANDIVRLGHESGGNWFYWGLGYTPAGGSQNTAAQYIAMFQRVVGIMRSNGFTGGFEYNGGGYGLTDIAVAYPGDAYVDYIGMDPYDGYSGVPAEHTPPRVQRTF